MKEELDNHLAKLRFSQGEFEISGSEQFVKEQIEIFKPNIQECLVQLAKGYLQNTQLAPVKQQTLLTSHVKTSSGEKTEDVEFVEVITNANTSFENVLAIENGKVQIITDIPGSAVAQKMINIILIYMWGKLQINDDQVFFTELREVCESHGEIDKSNFAKHMHKNKKYFIITGSGKSQQAKLIRPGIKEALKLISDLNK